MSARDIPPGQLFTFSRYPEAARRAAKALRNFRTALLASLREAITAAVNLSFAEAPLTVYGRQVWQQKALDALRDTTLRSWLQYRLTPPQGLSLSARVWNIAQLGKAEFELAMSDIITTELPKGTSAEELGRRVRHLLNAPDAMVRRYHLRTADGADRVEWRRRTVTPDGRTHFISTDIGHPGRGVYRSARQNALRLAMTETNAVYRKQPATRERRSPR